MGEEWEMKILAQRGKSQYLVGEVEPTESNPNPSIKLIDISQNTSVPMPLQQALKWGYWEEPETLSPIIQQSIALLYIS